MSPHRIVHIVGNRWWSAISAYAVDLAAAQHARGERVAMVAIADSPAEVRIRELGLPVLERMTGMGALAELTLGRRLRGALGEGDVVHVHTGFGHAASEIARRGSAVPLVRTRGDVRRPRGTPTNRWLYRRADALVLSGSFQRPFVERWVDATRVHVIPAPVDVDRFRPRSPSERAAARRALGLPESAPLLGLVARLSPVKGHETAIGALRHLRVGAHLLIAGEPSQLSEADLMRWADASGVSDRVHVRGRLDDVAPVVAALDVGIVASTGSEAICRIAGEMMAAGTPVVASEVSVLPDMVVGGRTGALVPPGNALLLAEALDRMLEDDDRRHAMGRAAREWISETSASAVVADAYASVYESAMATV